MVSSSSEVVEIFRRLGVVLEGHFLLSSGLPSPVYWEKFRLLQHPVYTEQLYGCIARQLRVRALFAEKTPEGKGFCRGLLLHPKEKVLLVDDILTTGGSIQKVLQGVEKHGAEVAGAAVLVDRSAGEVKLEASVQLP